MPNSLILLQEVQSEDSGSMLVPKSSESYLISVSTSTPQVDDALDLSSKFDALQRDVAHKMGADKDLLSKLDGLAKIEDVNKALLEARECNDMPP